MKAQGGGGDRIVDVPMSISCLLLHVVATFASEYLSSECIERAWKAAQPMLGGTGLHTLAASSIKANHIVEDEREMFTAGGNRLYVRSTGTFNSGQNTRNGGDGEGGLAYRVARRPERRRRMQ